MNTEEFEMLLIEGINQKWAEWDAEWIRDNPGKNLIGRKPQTEVYWDFYFRVHMPFVVDGTIITLAEEVGGGEGDGEYTHLVFRVEKDDQVQYFKKEGRYSSYDGTDWDYGPLYEVFPQERTIIVYE